MKKYLKTFICMLLVLALCSVSVHAEEATESGLTGETAGAEEQLDTGSDLEQEIPPDIGTGGEETGTGLPSESDENGLNPDNGDGSGSDDSDVVPGNEEDSEAYEDVENNLVPGGEEIIEQDGQEPRALFVPEVYPDESGNSDETIAPYASYDETTLFFELEERVKNALLSGKTEVSISDLAINKEGSTVPYLYCFSPYFSNGIETAFYYNTSNNNYTTIKITNTMSLSETASYFQRVDEKVAEIMRQTAGITSPEQIALIIHDYFVYEYEYDYDNYLAGTIPRDSYKSGGLFLNERGVCQAYAYAYKYIMNKLGIECYVTTSSSMNHAWNIINIDGSYYHVDCTWDDPVRDKLGQVKHIYFLTSDQAILSKKHSGWDLTNYACNNTAYDNAYWENVTSQIILNGEEAYYIADKAICSRNLADGTSRELKNLGIWNVWGGSGYWTGAYSGLFFQDGELYYNTSTEIKKTSPNGGSDETVHKPDTSQGYIYGSRRHGGELQYLIGTDPNYMENMTRESIPFSTSVPETGKYQVTYDANGGTVSPASKTVSQWEAYGELATPVRAGYEFAGWYTAQNGGSKVTSSTTVTNAGNHTLYAQWNKTVYTITYKLDGGKNADGNPASYDVETATITLKDPTKTGYVFDGWYTDSGYKTKVTQIAKGSTGDKTFYAKWSVKENQVTYDANGGKVSPSSKKVTKGSAYGELAEPTRKGYEFKGWYTSKSGGSKVTSSTKVTNEGDHTIYAQWEKTKYTITYKLDGGKNADGNPASYDVETATITLKEATKTGYTFDGWYTDSGYKTKVTQIAKGSTGDKTFYAKWNEKEIQVTYEANGGKVSPSSKKVTKGSAYGELAEPTRKGYEFKGWYTSKSGGSKVTSTTTVTSAEDHTIYAQWEKTKYTITYKLDGGKNADGNPASYDVETAAITLKAPTKTGYTFDGWYTDSGYKTKVTQIAKGSTGDKTFYAKWNAKEIQVTYEANGGKVSPASKKVTKGSAYGELAKPARKGYKFKGWYTSKSGGSKVTSSTKVTNAKNHTIYAQWTKITYTITYKLDGGKNASGNPANYTVTSATITLGNPTKNGYTFGGWYTGSDYGTKVTQIKKGSTGNKTLYAKWTAKAKKYTITYNLNGGKNSGSNPKSYTSASGTITLQNASKTGYRFGGWYTSSSYKTKVTKIPKGSTGNKAFYAKWTPNTYTIQYDKNGATSGNMANTKSCKYGTSYKLRKNTFQRKGYKFAGWATSKNGKVVYKNGASVKNLVKTNGGTIKLYAKWVKK